jgi:hypothetical protein
MKEIKEISDLMPEVQNNSETLQCTMDESGCCIVASNDTERAFWDDKWAAGATGWDLGTVAPELKNFFDSIENKSSSILIPGCGNAHEAGYLLSQGFTNLMMKMINFLSLLTTFKACSILRGSLVFSENWLKQKSKPY